MKKQDVNLQKLNIFSDLSNEEIDEFKKELNILKYKKNAFLFKPEDKAETMYIIAVSYTHLDVYKRQDYGCS